MGFLLLLVVVGAVRGDEGGLAHLRWTPVVDRASLTTALECSDCLLGLQITNGTEWLQIGGRDDTFLPIVIKDSQVAATSDLSLASALNAFNEKQAPGSRSGLHISFLTPTILESSLDVIGSLFPQVHLPFPLLISVVVLDSSDGRSSEPLIDGSEFLEATSKKVPGAIPVLNWATFHGLDPVWVRLGQEGILKSFQTTRLEGLVDSLYKSPESLSEQEVRFAELLDQKLERAEVPICHTELLDKRHKIFLNNPNLGFQLHSTCSWPIGGSDQSERAPQVRGFPLGSTKAVSTSQKRPGPCSSP